MSIRNKLLEQILAAINGGGGILPADNCRVGFFDVDDSATATTPLTIPDGGGTVKLTNDNLGPQSNSAFAPVGVSSIWNSTTNQFNFSQLINGDMVDLRPGINVTTTSVNQEVRLYMQLAIGAFTYQIPFARGIFKTVGTYNINTFNGIYIGDDNTRLNPAEFIVQSDDGCSIVVGGWYAKVLKRG